MIKSRLILCGMNAVNLVLDASLYISLKTESLLEYVLVKIFAFLQVFLSEQNNLFLYLLTSSYRILENADEVCGDQ